MPGLGTAFCFFFFFFSNAIESAILEKEVSTNYEEVLAAATR